jgi:hypothetical protein
MSSDEEDDRLFFIYNDFLSYQIWGNSRSRGYMYIYFIVLFPLLESATPQAQKVSQSQSPSPPTKQLRKLTTTTLNKYSKYAKFSPPPPDKTDQNTSQLTNDRTVYNVKNRGTTMVGREYVRPKFNAYSWITTETRRAPIKINANKISTCLWFVASDNKSILVVKKWFLPALW